MAPGGPMSLIGVALLCQEWCLITQSWALCQGC